VDFLDDLISEPFEKLGLDYCADLRPGQLCKAPILYAYENAQIWRPSSYDESGTAATNFSVIACPGDAYTKANILNSPRLEAYEEFPVLRAKFRPVIVVTPCPTDINLPGARNPGKINRHLCYVSPCYGLADAMDKAKFSPEFLKRVRLLEYPQFMFLRKSVCLEKDSLLRLDSIQHVYRNQVIPLQWSLNEEMVRILQGQLTYLLTKVYAGDYQFYRNALLIEAEKYKK
jgi:hypothetical protein